MNNVSHNKVWGMDTKPTHVEPSPIPLIKETSTSKSDEDYVKLKLRRGPTSSTSDIYDFRMSLLDHGEPQEFLLFVRNFKMTLAATGTLETKEKVHYLFNLFRGGVLYQFYFVSSDAKNTKT